MDRDKYVGLMEKQDRDKSPQLQKAAREDLSAAGAESRPQNRRQKGNSRDFVRSASNAAGEIGGGQCDGSQN